MDFYFYFKILFGLFIFLYGFTASYNFIIRLIINKELDSIINEVLELVTADNNYTILGYGYNLLTLIFKLIWRVFIILVRSLLKSLIPATTKSFNTVIYAFYFLLRLIGL